MKLKFGIEVFPESYREKEYFVEGVGKSIRLVDYELLTSSPSEVNNSSYPDLSINLSLISI